MRKIDWRHTACLWRHWQVWKYHRSIDKWKGYKLRKWYEVTKKVWKGCEEATKNLGCEVIKLRDNNAPYRDNLLWHIVMYYGKMPPATLESRDIRSYSIAMVLVLLLKKSAGKSKACAEHTYLTSGSGDFRSGPLPVTRLTSLPVTWLPIAPPNSTTTSEVLSVPIYYYALCVCTFFFWPLYCLWFAWRLQIVYFSERRLLKEAKQFDTLYIREHIVAFFLPVDKVIKYEEYWV
jgi:hypothetical protein